MICATLLLLSLLGAGWIGVHADAAPATPMLALAGTLLATAGLSALLVRLHLLGSIRQACAAAQAIIEGKGTVVDQRRGASQADRLLDSLLDGLLAQHALAEAGKAYENGLQCHPAATCVLDREGRLVFVNRVLQSQLGPLRGSAGPATAPDLERQLGRDVLSLIGTPERVSRGPVSPKAEHRTRIETAGQTFEVTTRPVIDASGQHLGWTSHWINAGPARELDRRVRECMNALDRGELQTRLDRQGLGADQQSMALLFNELLEKNQQSVDEIREIVDTHLHPATAAAASGSATHDPALFVERLKTFCETAAMNQLVRLALDCSSVPLRVVDRDGKILFLSRALERKVSELEPEIRRRIPGFDRKKLIGGSIGIFYPDPDAALQRLRTLTGERRSRLEIGGRDFDIVTHPILDTSGQSIGSVGEWVDRHDELRAERRLSELIAAASHGDFNGRIDLIGLDGFHLDAARGINEMMDQVSSALGELVEVLQAMSSSDLSRDMRGHFQGIFQRLQTTANETIQTMANTIGQIRGTADSVSDAARAIARGNGDLAQRTEQQATSLELTSTRMNELISLVTRTAEHSQTASRLANDASALASSGGATVGRVVQTMAEIGEASRQVEAIISVINSITFQTNILALNAAVEAARAGEQGRGFAVVATEVRTLAKRSSEAAREIRNLITTATERVDSGAKLVTDAGAQMNDIVAAIQRTTDVIGEIASAAAGQHEGIQQIGEEIQSMDEMTRHNAAIVEQANSAAASLDEQSGALAQAMSAFKLDRPAPERKTGAPAINARRSRETVEA